MGNVSKQSTNPNFLLCYLDCLRKDRTASMFSLQKLVQGAGWTTFANHRAVAHCSDPNFITILTGASPDQARIRGQMGHEFTKLYPTLPIQLRKCGWKTFAYEPVCAPRFYLTGFDDILWHKTSEVSPVLAPGIRKTIERYGTDPWFGFLRVMDTHYPYNDEPLPENKEEIPAQYDKAVEHVDRFVFKLCRWILRNYPNTIIAIGSDHGEGLGERGIWDHLYTLSEILLRVPLFVYIPDQPTRTVTDWTQHYIIPRVVLGAADLESSVEWDFLRGDVSQMTIPSALEFVAWGCASRDVWKHRAISVLENEVEYKYTVNWHLEHGAFGELHLNGDESINRFGNNSLSKSMVELMTKQHPTIPVPEFRTQGEQIKRAFQIQTPLGDGMT